MGRPRQHPTAVPLGPHPRENSIAVADFGDVDHASAVGTASNADAAIAGGATLEGTTL